jgi:hypothetical protein
MSPEESREKKLTSLLNHLKLCQSRLVYPNLSFIAQRFTTLVGNSGDPQILNRSVASYLDALALAFVTARLAFRKNLITG